MNVVALGLLQEGWRAGASVAAAVCAVGGTVAATRLLWESPVAPSPAAWAVVSLTSALAMAGLAVGLGGAVAVVEGLRRLDETGAWVGLRATGIGGRGLVRAAAAVGIGVLLLSGIASLWAEPALRRAGRRVLQAEAAEAALWPGRPLQAGAVQVLPRSLQGREARQVELRVETAAGHAETARMGRSPAGRLVLELGPGLLIDRTTEVRWERWVLDVTGSTDRIQLDERSTPELAEVARRTAAAGGDPRYEQAVWLKRWLHPLGMALLPLALLPGAVGRRPWGQVGLAVLVWVIAVRGGDLLTGTLGVGAAAAGPVAVALWTLVAWARWRDR